MAWRGCRATLENVMEFKDNTYISRLILRDDKIKYIKKKKKVFV